MHPIILKIIDNKIKQLERAAVITPLAALREAAAKRPRAPGFTAAAVRAGELSFVKEIKRASVIRGVLLNDYNPVKIVKRFYSEGAHAVSVAAECSYHMGSAQDVTLIRDNLFIPILYKDYILDKYQIYLAASLGASAVMLNPTFLADRPYREIFELCRELNMLPVPDCRSEDDIIRSLRLRAQFLNINGRSINSLAIDAVYARRLISQASQKTAVMAENCFSTPKDALELKALGVSTLLIGEEITQADFIAKTRKLEAKL